MLTAGKVIQMGTDITGKMKRYLLILRAVADVALVELVMMFSRVIMLPIRGRMPVGSGAVKSLNHRRPSVARAGLSL